MINVYVPDTTLVKKTSQLPVIYILDANLYFDIYAAILKKYSEVGLMPPAILIGVGYSSFEKMDSLRTRDYTYPVGLPEYEMPVSGKADVFLNFIQNELVPVIDRKFPSDTSNRILAGHSLGGYFAMYTLLQQLKGNNSVFRGFIAASPSLHYNKNYLLKQFDSVGKVTGPERKLYLSFGALENPELKTNTTLIADGLFKKLAGNFSQIAGGKIKTATFSEMDHMDTQIPSFIKGLQWIVTDL
jgi:predicted alpha/beta superfamily hydrolase